MKAQHTIVFVWAYFCFSYFCGMAETRVQGIDPFLWSYYRLYRRFFAIYHILGDNLLLSLSVVPCVVRSYCPFTRAPSQLASCHQSDNFQCGQWRQFHKNNIYVSSVSSVPNVSVPTASITNGSKYENAELHNKVRLEQNLWIWLQCLRVFTRYG